MAENESFLKFLFDAIFVAFSGGRRYKAWLTALFIIMVFGLITYSYQFREGLIITGMRDQVSWGLYISNFTFFVGVAASAVMIVIPLYIYNFKLFKPIITFGEYLAVGALLIVIANVLADIGRVDRLHHMLPILGTPNFPQSLLMWDMVVLTGYLLLNLLIPSYSLFKTYHNSKPRKWIKAFIYLSIPWAISIHTVTAFIYGGLVARPFWNTALMAPRFLSSAFASGPAFLIIALLIIRNNNEILKEEISEKAINILAQIVAIGGVVSLFFLGSEVFTIGYAESGHWVNLKYLMFGLEHNGVYYGKLVPFFWASFILTLLATLLLINPGTRKNYRILPVACFLIFTGLWIEKGLGLVIPGFIPSPVGEIHEYIPTLMEVMISAAGWAFGFFVYTLLVRVSIAIETGEIGSYGGMSRLDYLRSLRKKKLSEQ